MFKYLVASAGLALAVSASPALAQEDVDAGDYNGIYVGGSFGFSAQPNDGGSRLLFDTNRDGTFGDTVRNVAGADAFAPGFCGGRATSATGTCRSDRDGIEYYGMVGGDTQMGRLVIGVVGEFGKSEARDSVSAFSITPASYTFERQAKYQAGVRGRVGYTPNDSTLFYATGGAAYAKIRNRFFTSNTANAFTTNGNSDAWGYSAGGGVEQRIGRNFSIGLLYLYTNLKADDYRVTAGPGTAPATNPFLLANANGTDFRRSDNNFRTHSMRVTAAFRF
jgi:outer membrane immunogenic protein